VGRESFWFRVLSVRYGVEGGMLNCCYSAVEFPKVWETICISLDFGIR
jgi:hypothetical protein